MSKTNYQPLICSDKELKEIAEHWYVLVGEKPTASILNAFIMGAKIAVSNNGWIVNKDSNEDDFDYESGMC